MQVPDWLSQVSTRISTSHFVTSQERKDFLNWKFREKHPLEGINKTEETSSLMQLDSVVLDKESSAADDEFVQISDYDSEPDVLTQKSDVDIDETTFVQIEDYQANLESNESIQSGPIWTNDDAIRLVGKLCGNNASDVFCLLHSAENLEELQIRESYELLKNEKASRHVYLREINRESLKEMLQFVSDNEHLSLKIRRFASWWSSLDCVVKPQSTVKVEDLAAERFIKDTSIVHDLLLNGILVENGLGNLTPESKITAEIFKELMKDNLLQQTCQLLYNFMWVKQIRQNLREEESKTIQNLERNQSIDAAIRKDPRVQNGELDVETQAILQIQKNDRGRKMNTALNGLTKRKAILDKHEFQLLQRVRNRLQDLVFADPTNDPNGDIVAEPPVSSKI